MTDQSPASSGGVTLADGPTKTIRTVCVYCGAKSGSRPEYAQAAEDLGREIAARGFDLVYGSGSVGLMGVVARAVHAGGRHVIGVIPDALVPVEVSGPSVGEVRLVRNMHERKAEMAREADAFVALPGGFGTLEELLEMITWSQLGIHEKPVALLNVAGFYNHLLAFFDHATEHGFVTRGNRSIVMSAGSPREVLDLIEGFDASRRDPFLGRDRWKGDKLDRKDMVSATVEP